MDQRVSCSHCGHVFPVGYATKSDREPCPSCGGRGLSVQIEAAEELNIAVEVSIAVGPSEHDRTCARRWDEAANELDSLEQSIPDAEQATVFDAQRRLHHVLVDLWALREAAIREGVSRQVVDAAIKGDPLGLALAHDLGNVAKHGPLTRAPTSPHKPTFGGIRAERPGSGGPWRFTAVIRHGQSELDGVKVARHAIDKWGTLLKQWNLR